MLREEKGGVNQRKVLNLAKVFHFQAAAIKEFTLSTSIHSHFLFDLRQEIFWSPLTLRRTVVSLPSTQCMLGEDTDCEVLLPEDMCLTSCVHLSTYNLQRCHLTYITCKPNYPQRNLNLVKVKAEAHSNTSHHLQQHNNLWINPVQTNCNITCNMFHMNRNSSKQRQ